MIERFIWFGWFGFCRALSAVVRGLAQGSGAVNYFCTLVQKKSPAR